MMCFRDTTFCPHTGCSKFSKCPEAYTDQVKQAARRWWGEEGAPVSLWETPPKCYEGKE